MLPERRIVDRELGLVAVDGHGNGVAIDCDGNLLAGVARVGEGKLGLQSVGAAIRLAAGLEGNQVFTWNAGCRRFRELADESAAIAVKQANVIKLITSSLGRAAIQIERPVVEDMDILAGPGGILLNILHHTRRVVFGEEDILVTQRRKRDCIKDHARSAARKSTYPAIACLIDADAVALVRGRSTGMMQPLDGAISVVLCEKDVSAARPGVRY